MTRNNQVLTDTWNLAVSVIQDRNRPGKHNEPRLSAQFAGGEQDKLGSVTTRELITSKRPVFKFSDMRQTGTFTSKKGKPGMHVKSEPQNNLMLVNMVLACNQFFLFFAVKKWIQHKMPGQLLATHKDLNPGEIPALRHHRPQVCAVEDHLLHHDHSICAVGDHLLRCNPPVCAVSDHVLLESKKNEWKTA